MKYKVGDKVKIVSHWNKNTNQNPYGEMDKWLGKVMTIREISAMQMYRMVEDGREAISGEGWFWNEACIESLAKEFPKIVITTDGTETLARLYEGGKVVKSATAKCHPEDSFDAVIGAKIAFNHLFGTPEMPEEPKFFTGKAVCVKCESTRRIKEFTVGKIYEFVDGKTMDNFGHESPRRYRVDSNFETLKKIAVGLYDFLPIVE